MPESSSAQDATEPGSVESLAAIGWNGRIAELFEPLLERGLSAGRVVRVDGQTSLIATNEVSTRAEASRGILEDPAGSVALPAVGDWVALRPRRDHPVAIVEAVLPRTSAITRIRRGDMSVGDVQVLAANIDTVFIVQAVDNLNIRRLEREVVQVWESGAAPAIVLTKGDLVDDTSPAAAAVEPVAGGAQIHVASGITGDGMESLVEYTQDHRTIALIGASGVGKSTLANWLLGSEVLATSAVRAHDGRGRHTTTARYLVAVPGGGALIDTPGLRSFGMWDAAEGVAATFPEIEELSRQCRFSDCRHAGEPGCAVREATEGGSLDAGRLDSYRTLERELEHEQSKHDKRARAGRRKEARAIGRRIRRNKRGQVDW